METTRRGLLGLVGSLPFIGKDASKILAQGLSGSPFIPIPAKQYDLGELINEEPIEDGTYSDYYTKNLKTIKNLFGLGKGKIPKWKTASIRLNAKSTLRYETVHIPSIDNLKSIGPSHKNLMREHFLIQEMAISELYQAKIDADKEQWDRYNDLNKDRHAGKSVKARRHR